MLKTRFLRDRQHRVIGTAVAGYQDGTEIVKRWDGTIIGKVYTNQNFMRDGNGRISFLTADTGLAFGYSSEDNDE